jgi:DNA-binding CsgD family transcriptional regulator
MLPTMTAATNSATPLAPFGLDATDERVYRAVLRHSGATPAVISDAAGTGMAVVETSLGRLREAGLVRTTTDSVAAEPPDVALARLVDTEAQRLRDAQQSLVNARAAIVDFRAEQGAPGGPQHSAEGFEVVPTEQVPETVINVVTSTTGEMLFVRPDQWATSTAPVLDPYLIAEMQRGRPARALYPHHALEEAADPIRARHRAGERVRVLPRVPGRLAVFGHDAALMAAQWPEQHGNPLLIRHPGVVSALQTLFDELWQRATAVPGMCAEPTDGQRQLLSLLASGAIDEQMARTLGVSLRTIRRHIATLMTELGVTSRFQLGAEAVRRGWL